MISAAPGATVETTVTGFGPSLVGTLGVTILDAAAGATFNPLNLAGHSIARTTSGFTALDADGTYRLAYTAPNTPGPYTIYVDDGTGGQPAVDDLLVTTSVSGTIGGTGNERYLTSNELKASLQMTGVTFADADISVAIETASRYLEDEYNDGRQWTAGAPGEQRYYTRSDGWTVELGDLLTATSIDLDFSLDPFWDYDPSYWGAGPSYGANWGTPIGWGAGAYSTPLPTGSYRLLPIQAGPATLTPPGNGEPYRTLELARGSTIYQLPSGRDSIRITGTFGWQVVPLGVKSATTMIATRLLRRMRDAPFGLVSFGADERAVAVRQIATDPDIIAAIQAVTTVRTRLFA